MTRARWRLGILVVVVLVAASSGMASARSVCKHCVIEKARTSHVTATGAQLKVFLSREAECDLAAA